MLKQSKNMDLLDVHEDRIGITAISYWAHYKDKQQKGFEG